VQLLAYWWEEVGQKRTAIIILFWEITPYNLVDIGGWE